MWSGVVTSGDSVLVNQQAYLFSSPKRGDEQLNRGCRAVLVFIWCGDACYRRRYAGAGYTRTPG